MSVATSAARLAAAAVDLLVVQLPVSIAFFVLAGVSIPPPPETPAPELLLFGEEIDVLRAAESVRAAALERVVVATLMLSFVFWAVYLAVGHCLHGQTVGKRLLQLRLRKRRQDARPGLAAALARMVVGVIWVAVWGALAGFAAVSLGAFILESGGPAAWDLLYSTPLPEMLDELHSFSLAVAVGMAALAFGVTELVLVRKGIFLADRLSGTVVVQEGYGSG